MTTSPPSASASPLLGIHHVTAIAGDAQRNVEFYAGVLGLRLVKRTVNFDDPHSLHLYYGDATGRPGSLLTFFPWGGARAGRPGAGQVAVTGLAIVPGAMGFWIQRLLAAGVAYERPVRKWNGVEQVLAFRDPDGMLLELVASAGAATAGAGWSGAPGIDAEHAIRGVHGVTLWEERAEVTTALLADPLGFLFAGASEEGVQRFVTGGGGDGEGDRALPGTIVDVRAVGGFLKGLSGAGTVHHVAFRVADDETELALRTRVAEAGLQPTLVQDRLYFRSVYFREPGGVLFELATDGPGFTVDEPAESLGSALMLPAQYAAVRRSIEALLPVLRVPGAEPHPYAGAEGVE